MAATPIPRWLIIALIVTLVTLVLTRGEVGPALIVGATTAGAELLL